MFSSNGARLNLAGLSTLGEKYTHAEKNPAGRENRWAEKELILRYLSRLGSEEISMTLCHYLRVNGDPLLFLPGGRLLLLGRTCKLERSGSFNVLCDL